MARSVKIDISQKPIILSAMQRNGFLTQGYLAAHLEMALSTVNNFINGKAIYVSKFEELCDALSLDPQTLIPTPTNTPAADNLFHNETPLAIDCLAYDDCWVGRTGAIAELSEQLKGDRRVLLLLGLTGIGKTALAENLISHAAQWINVTDAVAVLRINGENHSLDFVTVARSWLKQWQIDVPLATPPEQLLKMVGDRLQQQASILLFDSFEYFLRDTETDRGCTLKDPLWRDFFQTILAAPHCPSRILITSQELPTEIVQQRFSRRWTSQIVVGLTAAEQQELFTQTGFELEPHSPEAQILIRIGVTYQGHPLVLRVILGEIWESFGGNIRAYWDEVQSKIEAVEQAIAAAEQDVKAVMGLEDQWKLHKLTRKVRLEVNRQRLQMVFERLERRSPDAYKLICAASVYRVPVQTQGWLIQLQVLVKRLENIPCSEERQDKALHDLFYRFLIEESISPQQKRLIAMHPLIRSVALEYHQQLIASIQNLSQSA